MKGCDEFEVAIEMRLHGALDADASASLTAHLAECPSCRAFEELARGTEKTMTQEAVAHAQAVDWEALGARTRAFIRSQARQRILAGTIVMVGMMPMTVLLGHDPVRSIVSTSAAGALAMLVLWALAHRKLRALLRHDGDAGELLFFYRREVEDRLDATKRIFLVLPVWLILLANHVVHPFASLQAWLGFLGMGLVTTAACAYTWFVRRPRIQRELDALKAGASVRNDR
jgi:hypothetical protein